MLGALRILIGLFVMMFDPLDGNIGGFFQEFNPVPGSPHTNLLDKHEDCQD